MSRREVVIRAREAAPDEEDEGQAAGVLLGFAHGGAEDANNGPELRAKASKVSPGCRLSCTYHLRHAHFVTCGMLQEPAVSALEVADLKTQGLTPKGEAKLRGGDTRCRPPKQVRALFPKLLPQFRLPSVVDTAHAEDIVMLWAHLTKKGNFLSGFLRTGPSHPIPHRKIHAAPPLPLQTNTSA